MNKTETKTKEPTYTLEDVGCYVDGARGIYAVDKIVRFVENHGGSLDDCGCDNKEPHKVSACEFASEIEDEADEYMNDNYGVESAYWGRNKNSDWGLWEIEED